MKKLFVIFVVFVLATTISACSPSKTDNSQVNKGETTPSKNSGIVAGDIVPNLKGSANHYSYILKNQTEKEQNFLFMSGKHFDYLVKDDKGNKVFQYSEGKVYTQSVETVNLQKGEEKVMGDFVLGKLKPGAYLLQVWLTSQDKNKYEINKDLEIN